MDVQTWFTQAGVIAGVGVGAFNEVRRRLHLRSRRAFEQHGSPIVAEVERLRPVGRNDNFREVELTYLDEKNVRHYAEVTLRAAEAAAIGLWAGAAVGAHVAHDAPERVQLDRPAINDDRAWVSLALGAMMFGALFAAGTFVP
jgi:hypothetical protein